MKITNKKCLFENIQNDVKRLIKDEQKTSELSATIDAFLQEYKNLTGQEKERLSELFWAIIKSLRNESIEQITDELVELNDEHLKKINSAKDKINTINSLISKVNKKSIEDIKRTIKTELTEVEQSDSFEYDRLNLARLREISEKAIDEGKDAYIRLLSDLEKQDGLDPIIKTSDCLGYKINDMKASVASSGYTEWCTARTSNNLFDNNFEEGLSIFYFPNEVYTYDVTNDGETETVTFGARFGVTIDDLDNQCQTEWNEKAVDIFIDLLLKYVDKKMIRNIIDSYWLYNKLESAINENDCREIEKLLELGADINCKNEDGNTSLIVACKEGDNELAEKILKTNKIIDIDAEGDRQETALILASENGSIDAYIVKLLLEQGADINSTNEFHETALLACLKRYQDSKTKKEKALLLLNTPNINLDVNDYWGNSVIEQVFLTEDVELKNELIDELIDKVKDREIKVTSNYFNQLLTNEIINNNPKAIKFLIDHVFDIDQELINAIVHFTDYMIDTEIVNLLLEAGADPNIKYKHEVPILFYACTHGRPNNVIKALLETGADPNVKIEGNPVLIEAAINSDSEAINLLVEYGADVNAKNEHGKTVLDYVRQHENYEDIFKFLRENGAKYGHELE